MNETCDYCHADIEGDFYLRPVGMDTLPEGGDPVPVVEAWCGDCEPAKDTDPVAMRHILEGAKRQGAKP